MKSIRTRMSALFTVLLTVIGLGCGAGIIPAIVTGLATAGQIIALVDDVLSPQYTASQDQCADQIESLAKEVEAEAKPATAEALTATVAACDELVDAWYALEAVVEHLKTAQRAKDQKAEQATVDKAKIRLAEYYDSYARFKGAVKTGGK